MAYQSLYRRYRSQNFEQIKGQPHVTQALRTAIKEGRHSHAYLFSGPRGTGKTSTARVLAKALNCNDLQDGEPCTTCTSCVEIEQGKSFDLHELDAASNNKVDDVRDLIAKVALGSPGRTKVYILDEVHMLTSGAENALLKTLEEPPDHVVFVLATTEPHKVVSTIRSRTQHFEFHLLPGDDLEEHLRFVIEDAGLDVDQDGIEYALRQGGGSARDTLSALDLVAAAGGVPEGTNVGHDLAKAIGNKDAAATIAVVQRALETGREPRIIGEHTLESLRNAFLSSMGAPLGQLSEAAQDSAAELAGSLGAATITRSLESLGQALVEMRQAPDPRVPLEVTLLRLARRDGNDSAALLQRIETLESEVAELRANPPAGTTPGPSAQAPPTPISSISSAGSSDPASPPPVTAESAGGDDASDEPLLKLVENEPETRPETASNPEPTPQSAGTDSRGPAAAARATLAETAPPTRTAPPPAPASKAPAAPTPPPSASTPPPTRQPSSQPRPPASQDTQAQPPSTQAPASQPSHTDTPTEQPASEAEQRDEPPAAAGAAITLDQLTSSFGDILDELPQRVRARFRLGKFVALDGDDASFGLPNAHVIDRCEEVQSDVEAALTAKFNRPIRISLVVDGDSTTTSAPPSSAPTARPTKATPEPADEAVEEVGDISELENAPDVASTGIERLTQAFPGAEVIEPND